MTDGHLKPPAISTILTDVIIIAHRHTTDTHLRATPFGQCGMGMP